MLLLYAPNKAIKTLYIWCTDKTFDRHKWPYSNWLQNNNVFFFCLKKKRKKKDYITLIWHKIKGLPAHELQTVLWSTHGKVSDWRMIHTVQDTFCNSRKKKKPFMIICHQTQLIFQRDNSCEYEGFVYLEESVVNLMKNEQPLSNCSIPTM